MPTAADNTLIFIEKTGHTYQRKHQEVADNILRQLQAWRQDQKIVMTVFTDPMMGLSYESEPIIESLQRTYGSRLKVRYVMSLLVRDVSDFMLPEERALDPEEGIRKYCSRLAGIYKNEETIGGLPINMDGFCLFDPEHRTSKPLNLAYKAALDRDLQMTRRLGIHSLPAYRIQCGGRSVVPQSFDVKDFVGAISGLTG
jgi:hypothetical protein